MAPSERESEPSWAEQLEALAARLDLPSVPPRLEVALTHPSWTNEHREEHRDNQRLEFLGDAVLGLCVSELLMKAFVGVDEGALTVMRASLVNGQALGAAARTLGIAEALRLGRGAESAGERHRTNVLADAMEAIIGAAFLDLGLEAARQVSEQVVREPLAKLVAQGGILRDAKSRLQEWLQARGSEAPSYEVVGEEGPPHAREFRVRVAFQSDDEAHVAEGTGRSKKRAEQDAAQQALVTLDAT